MGREIVGESGELYKSDSGPNQDRLVPATSSPYYLFGVTGKKDEVIQELAHRGLSFTDAPVMTNTRDLVAFIAGINREEGRSS